MEKNKWEDNAYNKRIRIRDTQLEKIKEIRDQKSMAGKLDEIIDYYLKMHNLNNLKQ